MLIDISSINKAFIIIIIIIIIIKKVDDKYKIIGRPLSQNKVQCLKYFWNSF